MIFTFVSDKKQTKMQRKKRQAASAGRNTVYTYGVFDLFHGGHVDLLQEARSLGDRLVVGLFTDKVSTGFKREPIIPFSYRKKVLEKCIFVDKVITQKELQPDKNILKLKPQILAKGPGAGWEPKNKSTPGEDAIKRVGGKVVRLSYHKGISTSDIIKKITKKHGHSL